MAESAICEAKVMQLFALFACLETADPWRGIAEAAVAQTERELREGADRTDVRLCYYAAALANLQYRRLIAAQGALSPTYAGSVRAKRDDTAPCTLAERLCLAYREAASDLLREPASGSFVFRGIR